MQNISEISKNESSVLVIKKQIFCTDSDLTLRVLLCLDFFFLKLICFSQFQCKRIKVEGGEAEDGLET